MTLLERAFSAHSQDSKEDAFAGQVQSIERLYRRNATGKPPTKKGEGFMNKDEYAQNCDGNTRKRIRGVTVTMKLIRNQWRRNW